MFTIKKIFSDPQVPQVSTSATPTDESISLIIFKDQTGVYKKDQLKLFGNLPQDIEKAHFDLLLALIEGKTIDESATLETLTDPFLYEKMRDGLKSLQYTDEKGLLTLIEDQIRKYLPYKAAKAIVERCAGLPNLPFAFPLAYEQWLLAQSFRIEEEAESYFADIITYHHEKDTCELLLARLNVVSFKSNAAKTLAAPQKNILENSIDHCSYRIESKMDIKKLDRFPIKNILKLTQYTEHSLPDLRELAQKALDLLKDYEKSAFERLQARGADVSQQHLLEYALGPKAHLFAYYNFHVAPKYNEDHCFHNRDVPMNLMIGEWVVQCVLCII